MNINNQINIKKTIFVCSNSVVKNNISYFNKLKKESVLLLIINSKIPDYVYLEKKI